MMTRSKQALSEQGTNPPNQVKVSKPQLPVADLGDLSRLPPELRNKIYEMVLTQPATVKLQSYEARKPRYVEELEDEAPSHHARHQVAPVDHKRNPAHRGQQFVAGKWVEVPSKTALVQVNKVLNAESSSILYGFNSFEFTSTLALERFLIQIRGNKLFLRSVGLQWTPSGHSLPAGRRAMEALLSAKSLHTVSLTSVPIHNDRIDSELTRTHIRQHVEMFLPILKARLADYKKADEGTRPDVPDILKVVPRLPQDLPHPSERECAHMSCRRGQVCKLRQQVYHQQVGECTIECFLQCANARMRSVMLAGGLQIEVVKLLRASKVQANYRKYMESLSFRV